ncbi:MAG: hypothetical protein HY698_06005 [Deltaproteobacteria bacterium]|nr:hypothetical protein [Deltaproteobacteria bacterium]
MRNSRFPFIKKSLAALSALVVASACGQDPQGSGDSRVGRTQLELDDVGFPPKSVSLLVLTDGTSPDKVAKAVEELGGVVLHSLPPRLVLAQLPGSSESIQRDLGIVARYDQAVDPSVVGARNLNEERFIRVFDNRYYPKEVTPELRTTLLKTAGRDEIKDELPPFAPPRPSGAAILPGEPTPEPHDFLPVPYAAGTVVVSVVLPESNGVAEPSTEDWSEDMVVETYEKIQVALEAVSRSEPNAGLRFILHYESHPAKDGLPGTVDVDWEFGKQVALGYEHVVDRQILSRLLGREVNEGNAWEAQYEYTTKLKRQYGADGAFMIKVAANRNFTAGLRAHAAIFGPYTTLDTNYSYHTFAHEFGHIFGALDEYCPDACVSPTALGGYLGMANANATYREGGEGINNGQGEDIPSLMIGNDPNQVNGYTRAAWGWLDTDGDGILEVRDTSPSAAIDPALEGSVVFLRGAVEDRGATRIYSTDRRSINRVSAVLYRFPAVDPTWFRIPVDAPGYRVTPVDLELGVLPAGRHVIEISAENSVGNVDPAPRQHEIVVAEHGINTPPHVRLEASPRAGSARTPVVLTAATLDLDGDQVQVRFDLDGDGRFDTPYSTELSTTVQLPAGVRQVNVEARDERAATATAHVEVLVRDDNAPPSLALANQPSLLFGNHEIAPTFEVASVNDPDGDPVEINWIAESATMDWPFRVETGFSADNLSFSAAASLPAVLKTTSLDLSGGDKELYDRAFLRGGLKVGPNLVATAAGGLGVIFTDIADRKSPRLVARVPLETNAEQMVLDGSRLFVLGSLLTVIDLGDPTRPREIKQAKPVRGSFAQSQNDAQPIEDGAEKGTGHDYFLSYGEKIDSFQIDLDIEHKRPSDLRIVAALTGEFGEERQIVLWDHKTAPGGRRTYSFTMRNAPGLRELAGKLAFGNLSVRVADDRANGEAGTLHSGRVSLGTLSRGVRLLPGAQALLGVHKGRYVVVAGKGLQVFDARIGRHVSEVSRVTGTGTYSGTLAGSIALVLSPLKVEPPKDPALASAEEMEALRAPRPRTRGFYAVDLTAPASPKILRIDETYADGGEIFASGDRFYFTPAAPREKGEGEVRGTLIGDARRFASRRDWILGTLPLAITGRPIIDGDALWASVLSGGIAGFDVRYPAKARLTHRYVRPSWGQLVSLGGAEAVLLEGLLNAKVANLLDPQYTISRTMRITAEARDVRGAVTRASRTIHVIPYDHAPVVQSLTVEPDPAGGAGAYLVKVFISDPDGDVSWDSNHLVRADLDGDGWFETHWEFVWRNKEREWEPLVYRTQLSSGRHAIRVQARDGFYAIGQAETVVEIP